MAPKPKILVVEDDTAALRQLEATLKAMGAAPKCLASSKKAAELLNKEKFDGAFLDWDTPELNGEQLTKLIRHSKSNAKIPIAMITEHTDTKSIAQGFQMGVTFFLSKPIGQKELGRLLNASRGAMLEERRRYARVPLAVPVHCIWGDKKITAKTIDISAGGLLLALGNPPAAGTEVTVDFTLAGLPPFSLKAEVVRASGSQCALKFARMTAEQRDALKSFAERHLARLPGGA
jgi:CheY-like chemotaxis protein